MILIDAFNRMDPIIIAFLRFSYKLFDKSKTNISVSVVICRNFSNSSRTITCRIVRDSCEINRERKVLSLAIYILETSRGFFEEVYLYLPATDAKGTTGVCGINQVLVKQAEAGPFLSAFLPTSRTDV